MSDSKRHGETQTEKANRSRIHRQFLKALRAELEDDYIWRNGGFIEISVPTKEMVEKSGMDPEGRLVYYRSNPSRDKPLHLVSHEDYRRKQESLLTLPDFLDLRR